MKCKPKSSKKAAKKTKTAASKPVRKKSEKFEMTNGGRRTK